MSDSAESEQKAAPTDAAGASTARRVVDGAVYAVRFAARHTPGWFAFVAGLLLVQSLIPALQVTLVNQLLMSGEAGEPLSTVLAWVMLVTLVTGLSIPMGSIAGTASYRMVLRLQAAYETDLDSFLADLGPDQVADPVVSNRIEAARGAAGGPLPWQVDTVLSVLGALVTAVTLFWSVWVIQPLAAVLVVLAMVPAIIAYSRMSQIRDQHYEAMAEARRASGYLGDHLASRRSAVELASLGTGWRMARLTAVARRRLCDVEDVVQRKLLNADLAAGVGTAVLLGGALVAIVVGTSHGTSHGAGVAAGIIGVITGIMATRGAASSMGRIMTDAPEITAYVTFLRQMTAAPDVPVVGRSEALVVRGLSYRYPSRDVAAISGVDFEARHGEMIAFVGANGAGKTTAVHCLVGVLGGYEGEILIDGVDARGMTAKERAARFGLVSQEFGRYELTVREALLLGVQSGDASDAELWTALRACDADAFVADLGGLDAQLGEQWGGRGISGGQWQRLALSRIYLRGAGVWILDEPTSAIDAEAEQAIFNQLHASRAERITLVVTHRAWTLREMDRIYVFDQGRVVETGTYTDLLRLGGRFADLFAQQAEGDIAALAAREAP